MRPPARLLIRDVEVGGGRVDVRLANGVITEVARGVAPSEQCGEEVVDGAGGALLPGLHDHHLHLLAIAAARQSVDCGAGLEALSRAPGHGWIRGVRAAVSVDRHALDALVPDRPLRVQHRSGALWMLNTRALGEVTGVLDDSDDVERDDAGEPTGRLWRYDDRLRAAVPPTDRRAALDLAVEDLLAVGITSVTDATPDLDPEAVALLSTVSIPVTMLGDPRGAAPEKIVVGDHQLPTLPALVERIEAARERHRGVAVHAVTREALVLVLVALDMVGRHPEDRIEHAAVVPDPELLRGLRVVTQPGFIADRGDDYLRDVAADDLDCLYRFRSLLEAGIDVVASSDAPYGPADPWQVLVAAAARRTPAGRVLGADERVPAAAALAGYLQDPTGAPRRITPGTRTGLVLLDAPLTQVLTDPHRRHVLRAWPTPGP